MSHPRRQGATALLSATLVATGLGCGHRGDPLPPLRRTPPAVAEFRLAQRGSALEASMIAPAASVDGVPFERVVVQILFVEGDKDLERSGRRLEVLADPRQRVVEELPLPQPGTIARAAARAIVGREKGPRTLTMALIAQSEVAPARDLRAELVAQGVRLEWSGLLPEPVSATVLPPRLPHLGPRPLPPGSPAPTLPPATAPQPAEPLPRPGDRPREPGAGPAGPVPPDGPATKVELRKSGFFVYRRAGTQGFLYPLSQEPLATTSTIDETAPRGEVCYVVRAAASVDPLIESAPTNEACLAVRDIQAPGAPTGLAVLPRERGLEVLWVPPPDPDLAGYRVYRETAGEPRARVAEVDAARSAWLDDSARPGVTYSYTVTAVDSAGNESAAPPPAEASLQ